MTSNLIETLKTIRELREINVGIWFEKERGVIRAGTLLAEKLSAVVAVQVTGGTMHTGLAYGFANNI